MTYEIYDDADNSLSILHCKGQKHLSITINHEELFNLKKDELEEFIGALLHVQAKIRKEVGNV
mgnify:CR=1 FL=1